MVRDWRLGVRIWWLRRRWDLVGLAYAFVPVPALLELGERLLLTEIDLLGALTARRRLR